MRFFRLLLFAAVFPVAALRAGPPYLTGDPGLVETKRLEFIPGWIMERRPGERAAELPAFELNYGLLPNVELTYESAWLDVRESGQPGRSGYGNSAVAMKYRLREGDKRGPAVAISPSFEFRNPGSDSARKGLVPDENTFGLDVRAEQEIGGFALGASAGRAFPAKSEGLWTYGVIVRRDLGAKVNVGLELAGEAAASLDRSRLLVNAGLQIAVGAESELLLGLGRELHNGFESRATLRTYLGWRQTF